MDAPIELKLRVLSFRGYYPKELPVADGDPPSRFGVRKHDLVQLYTDPGGIRTLRVSHIRRVR